MIIFGSHPFNEFHLNSYGHLYLNVKERYLGQHGSIYEGLEGSKFINTTRESNVNVVELFKKLGIPDDLVKYYPEIKAVVSNDQRAIPPSARTRAIVPCKEFKKYIIDSAKAQELLNVFRTKVPPEFAEIGDKTIAKFTHIINKERGADISIIHLFVTEFSLERGSYSWAQWYKSTKFIVTDNLMNPIDVDALIEVINKICIPL